MPQPCALAQLGIAEDSELAGLLRDHPDIEPLRFADEETLVDPSDEHQDIFLVVRGTVVVMPADGSERQELAILEATPEAPIFVGEMAYLDAGRRSARVRSAMNTLALRLRPAHIDAIIAGYPLFTRVLCREFARRLRATGARLAELQALFALPGEMMPVSAGTQLYAAGDAAGELVHLIDGRVRLHAAGAAEARELRAAPEGALLGLREFLRGEPQAATATMASSGIVVRIPASARVAVVRRFPEQVAALFALS